MNERKKNEEQSWGKKELKKENFNPTLLAMSINSNRLCSLGGVKRNLQVAQPVEQVTAADLSLLLLWWLFSLHKELD